MKELATALELLAEDLEEIAKFDEETFMNYGSSELQYIAIKLKQISKGIL